MGSVEKPVQKHYQFPFFSLPHEVRNIVYRNLFVSDDLVDYYGVDTFYWMARSPGMYEMLRYFYEATSSFDFLQESLETFFRRNIFSVSIQDIPSLLMYRRLSVQSKEHPYISEEAIRLSTIRAELGLPPSIHGDDPSRELDEAAPGYCSVLPKDEWDKPKLSLREALEMSTWIRSILVPITNDQALIFPQPFLLELCKLSNLRHVSIMIQIDRWPLQQWGMRAEASAAACLKELRSRFGTGLRLIYCSRKEKRKFQVCDSFIDLLCAGPDAEEGDDNWLEDWSDTGWQESQWTEDWLEEIFNPLEQSVAGYVRSVSNFDVPSAN